MTYPTINKVEHRGDCCRKQPTIACTRNRRFSAEMSVVPHGMFVARKVRENEKRIRESAEMCTVTPTKYSSKYMDSIWGMYNRYSVHNLKKNMDEIIPAFVGQQKESAGSELGALSPPKNLLPAPGFL